MNKLAAVGVGLIALFGLSIFIVANLSVPRLVDFGSYGLQIENTTDARIYKGNIKLRSVD